MPLCNQPPIFSGLILLRSCPPSPSSNQGTGRKHPVSEDTAVQPGCHRTVEALKPVIFMVIDGDIIP